MTYQNAFPWGSQIHNTFQIGVWKVQIENQSCVRCLVSSCNSYFFSSTVHINASYALCSIRLEDISPYFSANETSLENSCQKANTSQLVGLKEEVSSHDQTCALRSLRQGQQKLVQHQLMWQWVKIMSGCATFCCYLYKMLFKKKDQTS